MAAADPDLTKPERLLWEAVPRGAPVNLRDASSRPAGRDSAAAFGPDQVIRAEVIRALVLGAAGAEPGFVPGVRLAGARVTGRLDLAGATLAWPLACDACHFDEEIVLDEAVTRAVRIVRSRFPAFSGVRLRVDGILSLQECSAAGVVRLDQAKVAGEMSLRGAAFGADPASVAVSADGVTVDGDVDCAGLQAQGGISLPGLHVTGSVSLAGACVVQPGSRALAIGDATIGGRLVGHGLEVDGETVLHDTTVTRIELTGARLSNGDGLALSAGGLTVTGGMFCGGGFTARGQVLLVGARLGANLSLGQATLSNPGNVALRLDRASIGMLDAPGLRCTGRISAAGMRVASDVSLERASIDGGGPRAFIADGAVIDGTLRLADLHARGEVSIRTSRVGQRVILRRARLENSAGTALSAIGLQAGELSLDPAQPILGVVDLSHAQLGILRDDPACWPAELSLDGLTYSALEPQLPARLRLEWLARHQAGHQVQPYEQLAAHYRGLGQPAEARRVLYARERLQRRSRAPLARTWSLLQDVTVAYGYQPWRALLWLAVLLAAGSILFSVSPPPPFQASAAPHFNAFAYTLDLLLPVVDLGLKHAFNPAGAEQWFAYLLVAAGWVLATTVAAGAARVLSRG